MKCKDGEKDEKGDEREVKKLRDEIRNLKGEMKGLGESVEKLLWILVDWIKREKVVEVRLEGDNKLFIKLESGKTETLKESSLTPAQLGLKKYLERSSRKSLSRQELENLVQGAAKEEKDSKRRDLIATVGGILIIVVLVAVVIGIVAWVRRKT